MAQVCALSGLLLLNADDRLQISVSYNKLCVRPPQYAPASCKLTLKVVSESRVTWATCVPFLIFLGLSVLDGPDVRDRQMRITA